MAKQPFELDLGSSTYAHIDVKNDLITVRQYDINDEEMGSVLLGAKDVENILDAINRAR